MHTSLVRFHNLLEEINALSLEEDVRFTSVVTRPLNLEALKIWSWKPKNLEKKNLEIDYYLYFWGLGKKGGTFSV